MKTTKQTKSKLNAFSKAKNLHVIKGGNQTDADNPRTVVALEDTHF